VAAVALAAAACGSSSTSATVPTTPAVSTTTESPASAVAGLTKIGPATATGLSISLAKGVPGIFLIGPNGRTLYIFTKDQGSTSACTSAACVKTWPALRATGALTTGPSVNSSEVAVTHGQVANQVTYYGHLLYYFEGDKAPGQTNGTSIPDWDLLGPFGNVMLPRS
jgi:predicted lipoprotein with Yx(FWY)xxD motif